MGSRLKMKLLTNYGNYTRMLRAMLNKSWRQHPPQSTNYTATCRPSRKLSKLDKPDTQDTAGEADELISDGPPTYGRANAGRPARTYVQQLCENTGCSPEGQPEATNEREKWRERVRDIRASGTTWWRFKCTSLVQWVECSPMVWKTWVQSRVVSYQRLQKLCSIPPCLKLGNIRYISQVKWRNPAKVAPPYTSV